MHRAVAVKNETTTNRVVDAPGCITVDVDLGSGGGRNGQFATLCVCDVGEDTVEGVVVRAAGVGAVAGEKRDCVSEVRPRASSQPQ